MVGYFISIRSLFDTFKINIFHSLRNFLPVNVRFEEYAVPLAGSQTAATAHELGIPTAAKKVPVVDNNGTVHNYALTPLGSLLYLPWEYKIHRMNGFMVQKFLQNKEIFSKVYPYSNIQMNIVFEFQRDGSLKYWFKDDYITEVNDWLGHTILKSKDLKLRKIYATGKWLANFNDSTISIDFGINDFQLEPISARIKSLNSSQMVLEQNFILDSTSNGQLVKIQKNITTYFTHY